MSRSSGRLWLRLLRKAILHLSTLLPVKVDKSSLFLQPRHKQVTKTGLYGKQAFRGQMNYAIKSLKIKWKHQLLGNSNFGPSGMQHTNGRNLWIQRRILHDVQWAQILSPCFMTVCQDWKRMWSDDYRLKGSAHPLKSVRWRPPMKN